MTDLRQIVDYLDAELAVADFDDSSNNGLQVENSGKVAKICCGVDASLRFFREAQKRDADMLICHHGISWQDSLKTITGLNYRRIEFLISHDIALYTSHLPLDAHPRYGNNALICKALGLKRVKPFGLYRGKQIGFCGELSEPTRYVRFKKIVAGAVGTEICSADFGAKTVSSVAVVSGAAPEEIAEAAEKGIDVYITGETALSAHNLAEDYGINAVFAGHYATEKFGVMAVTRAVAGKFHLRSEFVDLAVPL